MAGTVFAGAAGMAGHSDPASLAQWRRYFAAHRVAHPHGRSSSDGVTLDAWGGQGRLNVPLRQPLPEALWVEQGIMYQSQGGQDRYFDQQVRGLLAGSAPV